LERLPAHARKGGVAPGESGDLSPPFKPGNHRRVCLTRRVKAVIFRSHFIESCPPGHFRIIQARFIENIVKPAESNSDIEPCLAVVMPVYNEAGTITEVVKLVLAQRPVQQLVIVDDASSDGTWEKLQALAKDSPTIRLTRHERNQGKGAALRTGFQLVTAPLVIVQDADLEYDPAEYHRVLAPILAGRADVVFGSRFLGGSQGHRVLYYWHYVGNRFLTTLSNMATNLNLTDMEACYKAYRREVIQRIVIQEQRFGCEPEITAKVARLRVRVYEVGISYYGRTYAEGKKIGWRDGFHALWCILKYNWLAGS
jgi:glycosyltransferase involved in cell wall biosynthesis